jgi:hypothetical protein
MRLIPHTLNSGARLCRLIIQTALWSKGDDEDAAGGGHWDLRQTSAYALLFAMFFAIMIKNNIITRLARLPPVVVLRRIRFHVD